MNLDDLKQVKQDLADKMIVSPVTWVKVLDTAIESYGREWISVNDERKPAPGQVILVYTFSLKHGEDDEGNYRGHETEEVSMGEYRRTTANGTDYHFDCFTFPSGDVDSISHWMPLPKAPE